jgi:hypothetical protein
MVVQTERDNDLGGRGREADDPHAASLWLACGKAVNEA